MVELVDTLDLESSAERREGSNPSRSTNNLGSSNGRKRGFEPRNRGSSPRLRTKFSAGVCRHAHVRAYISHSSEGLSVAIRDSSMVERAAVNRLIKVRVLVSEPRVFV